MVRLFLLLFPFLSFFSVKDISMKPVLNEGDTILVVKTKRIRPGDLAVFESPTGDLSVKSCLLAEGDAIVVEHNFLVARGNRYFLQPGEKSRLLNQSQVPHGSFFFVGENSYHSVDSRAWGFIENNDIMGKVIFIKRQL